MLDLEPIEVILRAIPEGLLYMLGVYVFSNNKINRNKYIISSLVLGFIIFFLRELPISYGVHTIILILIIVFSSIFYNKIDSIKSTTSTIIIFLIQILSEIINISLLKLFNLDIDVLFLDPFMKNILGIPSLIVTLILILSYKKIRFRGKDE